MARGLLPVFVLAAVASAVSAQGPSAYPQDTDVHLLFPGAGYTRYYDPLMAETAVHLAGFSLKAEHGLTVPGRPSRPADEPDKHFPRIELRPAGWPEMSVLRLTRRGDTFIFSASADGDEFLEIGRARTDMPEKVHVGAMVFSYYHGHSAGAIVDEMILNGEVLTETKVAKLGDDDSRVDAYWSGDRLHLRTLGYWTDGDRRPRGPLAYVTVEGDFILQGRLRTFTHVPKWRYWGLACYADLREDAEVVGTYSDGAGLYGGVQQSGSDRLVWVWDGERHFIRSYLLDGKNQPQRLARVWASPATWDKLVQGIGALAEPMRTEVVERSGLYDASSADAVAATGDQLTALRRARRLALSLQGRDLLTAARWIEDVLLESPTCPEAHYAAAMTGAMLAIREPTGGFHDRARLLARPLAHLLLARRLAEPSRIEDRLAEAWVMLACGYPDAALRAVEDLDPNCAPAELRALRMFATRDTRGLDVHRIAGLTPLERAAWAWAAAETEPEALRLYLAELARLDGTPAALPVAAVGDARLQEALVRAGLGLSAGGLAADLLHCAEVPRRDRMAAAERLAGALGIRLTRDLPENANLIGAKLFQDGLEDAAVAEVLAALMELCSAAENATADAGEWTVLTPADYVAAQRGLLLTWLYRRGELLSRDRDTRRAAREYCISVAEALGELPGAAEFFRAFAAAANGEVYRTRASLRQVFESPLGRNIPAMYFVAVEWPGELWRRLSDDAPYRFGRGSWELALQARAAGAAGSEGRRIAIEAQRMRIDAHARPAGAADAGTEWVER